MNFKKTILLLGLMSVSLGTVAQQREIFSNPVINAMCRPFDDSCGRLLLLG